MRKRDQKDILGEIKALEARIDDAKNIRKHRPDIVELENKIHLIKGEYHNYIKPSLDCWFSDIQALKRELCIKKREKEIQISEKVKKWFREYGSGINWGYKEARISWISEDERFVIITHPGGTAGTGTAMGTGSYYYAQSSHWLTEVEDGKTYNGSGRYKRSSKWLEHEGRLTKEVKQKMIDYAEELRKAKP